MYVCTYVFICVFNAYNNKHKPLAHIYQRDLSMYVINEDIIMPLFKGQNFETYETQTIISVDLLVQIRKESSIIFDSQIRFRE